MLVPEEPSKVPHNPPSPRLELVIILTILAIQRGRAEGAEPHPVHRSPNLPPEGLHVPGVGLGIADPEEPLVSIEISVHSSSLAEPKNSSPPPVLSCVYWPKIPRPDGLCRMLPPIWCRLALLQRVHIIEATRRSRSESRLSISQNPGLKKPEVSGAFHPGVGIGRRYLDAVPVSRIHQRQIPEVRVRARDVEEDRIQSFLLAPRGLEREAAPGR